MGRKLPAKVVLTAKQKERFAKHVKRNKGMFQDTLLRFLLWQ